MNRVTLFCVALLFATFEALADGNSNFEVFANLDTGPGNVTATANGRTIMSQHQFYQPQYTVVEYKDQTLAPFPNKEMAAVISIPPKYSVAEVVGYLKGKSAISVARQFGGRQRNFNGENLWARGYAVSTVGFGEKGNF